MGAVKQDLEERTINKADEIAEQRYGREFNGLPASLQMTVWMDAEKEVAEENGVSHWDELELQRRLGK